MPSRRCEFCGELATTVVPVLAQRLQVAPSSTVPAVMAVERHYACAYQDCQRMVQWAHGKEPGRQASYQPRRAV